MEHLQRAAEFRACIKAMPYYIDICSLLEKCDRTGYIAAHFGGMKWDGIPKELHGRLAADIRKFRRLLKEGGYGVL